MHIGIRARVYRADAVCCGLVSLLRGMPALYRGTHLGGSRVTFVRARRVEAEADGEVLIDADGEQPGRLPAAFQVLPGALLLGF